MECEKDILLQSLLSEGLRDWWKKLKSTAKQGWEAGKQGWWTPPKSQPYQNPAQDYKGIATASDYHPPAAAGSAPPVISPPTTPAATPVPTTATPVVPTAPSTAADEPIKYNQIKKLANQLIQNIKDVLSSIQQKAGNNKALADYATSMISKIDAATGILAEFMVNPATGQQAGKAAPAAKPKDTGTIKMKSLAPKKAAQKPAEKPAEEPAPEEKPQPKSTSEIAKLVDLYNQFVMSVGKVLGVEGQDAKTVQTALLSTDKLSEEHRGKLKQFLQKTLNTFTKIKQLQSGKAPAQKPAPAKKVSKPSQKPSTP